MAMMPMWAIGTRNDGGTTLVELLVVLSILAAIMAMGVTGVSTLDERRLDREATSTYEWLKAVRREAMLHGVVYRVVVDGPRLETLPRSSAISPKQNGQVQFAAKSENALWQSLCFFPDGSSCPGSLELTSNWGKRKLSIGWFGNITLARWD